VGEERSKGEEDPDMPQPGSLAELEAEASVPTLEAEAATLSEAIGLPTAEDAAEAFHQRARLAEDRLAEVLGAYRKVKAENDSYRERMKRTLERQYEQRSERLLLKFIDVLDNFDRALEAAQTSYAGEPLVEGLILVRTQLLQTLKEQGLERVPVLGLPYDPHVSEAVGTQAVEDPDHHHLVVKELLRGYRLKGKVARHSRVLIGECALVGEQATMPPPPPEAPIEAAAPEVEEEAEIAIPLGEAELSLEEIIARAEAQEALFPPPEAVEVEAEPEPTPPVPTPPVTVEPLDASKAAEPFTAVEETFEKSDTRPIVFPEAEGDTLAAALAEEGWPEGLELPGLEQGPVADPKGGKR
jgi:molecular chaperone GrpE